MYDENNQIVPKTKGVLCLKAENVAQENSAKQKPVLNGTYDIMAFWLVLESYSGNQNLFCAQKLFALRQLHEIGPWSLILKSVIKIKDRFT